MSGAEPAEPAQSERLVAGRYRVLAELGRGGMAVVYRVHDPVEDRMLALKRLRDSGAARAHVGLLFEREFQTLSQLVHPRIIEVYDYQTDDVGPFYTMELLNGGDLRQRAPLAWRQTCRLVCDVCSAIALLHSRRFAHRDLTPLNIRCTLDGRAKLFDFGSMTQFGRSKHIVGTPQFLAPEVLHGQHVDARADLFSLGATLYFTLTGRHAFAARELGDLPALWREPPPPPSALVPDVPAALDQLVSELLRLRAEERPSSAAVVMERLSAIGGFELQEALWVGQSYLSAPMLVGRDDLLATVAGRLREASQGRCRSLVVEGSAGSGRSRFLDACALHAKLAGAWVVVADRADATGERWGVARALYNQLTARLPSDVVASQLSSQALRAWRQSPDAGVVADGLPERTGAGAGVSRVQLQTALREAFEAAARLRTLAIVVDDFDQIDEPSAAFLAVLAAHARDAQLLVVVTTRRDGESDLTRAVELLSSVADLIRLNELEPDEVHQLVVSLFGDAAHAHYLAGRIHSVTHGNPLLIMRAAGKLVDKGLCRYAAGAWSLPSQLSTEELHEALAESGELSLPASALEVLRIVALVETERLSVVDLCALTSHGNGMRLQADLLELSRAGLLTLESERVTLSRLSSARLVLQDASDAQLRELHERAAHHLERSRGRYDFATIQHRLAAGQAEQAFDDFVVLRRSARTSQLEDPGLIFEYLQSLPARWPQTIRQLIELGRRLGRPKVDVLMLEFTLLGYSALTARSERDITLSVADQLRTDIGLDLIEASAPELPASELLQRALSAAQQRREALPPEQRGLPLLEAITMLAQVVIQAIGLAGRTFDVPLLQALPSLTPLVALSPALAVVQKNLESTIELLSCRSHRARQGYAEILERLQQPDGAGLNGTHLRHMRLAVVWGLGAIDANAGRATALERAAQLEADPLFAISAHRLRAFYALARGDRAAAEAERMRIELLQIQERPPQLFEGVQALTWAVGYAALSDLLRVKQAVVDIERLAREDRGWQPVLHHVRGVYQALRGDHAQAVREYDRALAAMPAGQHLAYMWSTGARLWSLYRLRRFEDCVQAGRGYLHEFEQRAMMPAAHNVLVPLALAESCLGDMQQATAHCHAAIDALRVDGGAGVQLGSALHARAQIAIQARDVAAFTRYTRLCGEQFRSADAGLRARHAQLLVAGRVAGLSERRAGAGASAQMRSRVGAIFAQALDASQRAAECLALIGRYSRCQAGHLYVLEDGRPKLVAQLGEAPRLSDMNSGIAALLAEALHVHRTTETTRQTSVGAGGATQCWPVPEGGRYVPMLLRHVLRGAVSVTGVAVMYAADGESVYVPESLLTALSEALHAQNAGTRC